MNNNQQNNILNLMSALMYEHTEYLLHRQDLEKWTCQHSLRNQIARGISEDGPENKFLK